MSAAALKLRRSIPRNGCSASCANHHSASSESSKRYSTVSTAKKVCDNSSSLLYLQPPPAARKKTWRNLPSSPSDWTSIWNKCKTLPLLPSTVATEAWYTGFHPYTLEPVFSAKTQREKLAQRQFFFWYKPEERRNIINELRRIGRTDFDRQAIRETINTIFPRNSQQLHETIPPPLPIPTPHWSDRSAGTKRMPAAKLQYHLRCGVSLPHVEGKTVTTSSARMATGWDMT